MHSDIKFLTNPVIQGAADLTYDLVHSLDKLAHYEEYAARALAAQHLLGPLYNAVRVDSEEIKAHVEELYALAERKMGLMKTCSEVLVTCLLMGIFDPENRAQLFWGFEWRKRHYDAMQDQLWNIQAEIEEWEAILEMRQVQLQTWLEQLRVWESQRQAAISEGEEYLEEVYGMWEDRNEWLVHHGLAPIQAE